MGREGPGICHGSFEMCNKYLWCWRSLEANVRFDVLIGTMGSHMSLLSEVRLFLAEGKLFHK